MRLRVVWNNVRLVVSYSNPGGSAKVSDLLDHVAAALKRAGVSFDADNRFQHLSLGGFIVSSNDLVADVIENNDVIEVTDYYGWIAEKRALAKHSWYDSNATVVLLHVTRNGVTNGCRSPDYVASPFWSRWNS
jgi:hypothetical protein